MRVAYVCADPGVPVFGAKGASVHVQSVVAALRRRGAEVDLLAARLGGEPPAGLEDVRVHRLPRVGKAEPAARERALLAANRELAATLAALGPLDLVYERCSLWSVAGMCHASRLGLPGVLEVNAPLVHEQATHRVLVHRDTAERVADGQAAQASVLVAVSDAVADHLRVRHPEAAERVHVVPNGVDPERFPPALGEARAAAARPFTVGFLGTLKPWHGLPVLAAAFARLRARVPDARLLVVGDGPERPGLERELARRGVLEAVELAGAVAPGEVPGLLARMDVSVAPYPAGEGCYFSPLKVVESMAAGLPVVASRTGQLEQLVADGRTGWLVAPGDPAALTAALAWLAVHASERAAMGAAGRQAVLARHTWDGVVARVLALAAPALAEAAA